MIGESALLPGGSRHSLSKIEKKDKVGDDLSEKILLTMKNINKSFPGVRALDAVNFELKSGEVHALLGENGAGKSTLIKVLGGIYIADEGEIFIEQTKVEIDVSRQHTGKRNCNHHQELVIGSAL